MFGKRMKKGFFGPGHGWGYGRGRGFDPRRGRMFEKGDLKYVVLDLLAEKPSHGYEVMKALEERFRGLYSPSPGSVYPTLQLLEDLGYVTVTPQDGKKVYQVTEEGRGFLEQNRGSVDKIWGRVEGGWDPQVASGLHEMRHEIMGFGQLFGRAMHEGRIDQEKLQRIRSVISGATREIEEILEDRGGEGTRA